MRCLPAAEIINVGASLHVVKCRARPVLKNTRAALLEDPGFSRTEQSFATTEEQVHKHGEWELGALQSYMYFTTWIRSNPRNPGECPRSCSGKNSQGTRSCYSLHLENPLARTKKKSAKTSTPCSSPWPHKEIRPKDP